MDNSGSPKLSTRAGVIAAFAALYLIWGSTYLAIRFAIETLPPFSMGGVRFVVAGIVLYIWSRLRGAARPGWLHWRAAAIVGALLLFVGNGGVMWAEQVVPSGLTALLIAMTPLWMVVLDWARPGGVRPSSGEAAGVVLGLVGVILLIGPGELLGGEHVNPLGAGVILFSAFAWAVGSLYARQATLPSSPLMATALEMLAGGGLLLVAGGVTGEWKSVASTVVSLRSLLAFGYLIIFGSLVAFTAYVWLLNVTTPARVSTYAYVNPVVAVLLGWALAGETLTARVLVAAAVIVMAVVVITTYRSQKAAPGTSTIEPARSHTQDEVQVTGGEPFTARCEKAS